MNCFLQGIPYKELLYVGYGAKLVGGVNILCLIKSVRYAILHACVIRWKY